MKKHIIKENVSLNDSVILEAGDKILLFSEKSYKEFQNKNKGKVTERVIKEDEADADKSTNDDAKTDDDKKDETAMPKMGEEKVDIKEDLNGQSAGEMLIEKFGLQNLPNVYICKITGSNVPIYHIVFDSYKENLALTKSSVNAKHNITLALGNGKMLTKQAYTHLRDYHGSTNGIFILNDLAGSYMSDIDF